MKSVGIWLGMLIAVCVGTSAIGFHGFSMSSWRWVLDGPNAASTQHPPEILHGHAQLLRSDDWSVVLAISLAQRAHRPPFPEVNLNYGMGQSMWVVPTAPIAHPLVVFRPQAWGYFVSDRLGLAWNWSVYVWGLLFAFAFLFRTVFEEGYRRHPWVVVGVAPTLLLWSPFFQYWSLNSSVLAASAAAAIACAIVAYRTESTACRWTSTLGLFWTLGVFFHTLYPPFQIPLVYLGLALAVGCAIDANRTARLRRIAPWAVALTFLVAMIWIYWQHAHEAIETMTQTVYPGRRSDGGGSALWMDLFRGNVLPLHAMSDYSAALNNPCEAASFLMVSPLALACAWYFKRFPPLDARGRALILFACVFGSFQFFGWPLWLSKITGLGAVPSYRSTMVWGIWDACAALYLTCQPRRARNHQDTPISPIPFLVGVGACFVGLLIVWHARIPNLFEKPRAIAWIALLGMAHLVGAELLRRDRVRSYWFGACALSFLMSQSFNPWIAPWKSDVTAYLRSHPLALALRASGPSSVWWVYQDQVINNYLTLVGVRSLTALEYSPHWKLWRTLDPQGTFDPQVNRYAHIEGHLESGMTSKTPLHIVARQSDALTVAIHPDHPRFLELPVTHLLISGPLPEGVSFSRRWRLQSRVGRFEIYERL